MVNTVQFKTVKSLQISLYQDSHLEHYALYQHNGGVCGRGVANNSIQCTGNVVVLRVACTK